MWGVRSRWIAMGLVTALGGCATAPKVEYRGQPSRNWERPVVAVLADIRVQGDPAGMEPGFRPSLTRQYRSAIADHLSATVGVSSVVVSPGLNRNFDERMALVELLARAQRAAVSRPSARLRESGVGPSLLSLESLGSAETLVLVAGSITVREDDVPINDVIVAAVDIPTGRLIAVSAFNGADNLLDQASLTSVLGRLLRQ